jgi:beta-phosphoglucomutase
VVFDFDGVIVDSEPFHFRSLRDALRPEGVEITEEEYLRVYLAYDDREAIRLALEQHGERTDPARREDIEARKSRSSPA